ncbi:unnamed protein product [Clonostachys rhizophaga]|uniref:Heterokaryon incompatibility domain-containing protein n=1 Tax=Clonostachys rhizophaga TaxID=160324 RepID=A0A9N9V9Q2_9HYPO|nr:unnamed protein product [Clonostachys rhizophaga]
MSAVEDNTWVRNFLPGWYAPEEKVQFARPNETLKNASPRSHAELYQSLNGADEIRVMELKPGNWDDGLCASLHHCSMESEIGYETPGRRYWKKRPMEYTAISYAWGKLVYDGTIDCDGHTKAITKTLEVALRHFRHPQDSILIWVDQICINQGDEGEKTQQVLLMGKIYGLAMNTVAWLGEADSKTPGSFDILGELGVRLQYSYRIRCPGDLISLLCRPWFSRLRIIQEVVLSENLWIKCGPHVLHWDVVSNGCGRLVDAGIIGWLGSLIEDGPEAANTCQALRQLMSQQDSTSYLAPTGIRARIFTLLKMTQHALCSDPRDKIYGMLAMASQKEERTFRVDYSSGYTFSNLYLDVAIDETSPIQKYEGSIHSLLSAVEASQLEMTMPLPLPSWVPDWRPDRRRLSRPFGGGRTYTGYRFCASGDSEPNFELNPADNSQLHIQAYEVDSIADISNVFLSPSLSYQEAASSNRDLLSCLDLSARLKKYPGSCTVFDAFWLTTVAGVDETGDAPAPHTFAEAFSILFDATTGRTPSLPGQSYTKRQQLPEGRGRLTPAHLREKSIGTTYGNALSAFQAAMSGRRFGITAKGYIGLFPCASSRGDSIILVSGCPVPYVIRRVGQDQWRYLGECYVHGMMNREVIPVDGFSWETIILV